MKYKAISTKNFKEKEIELPDDIFNVPVRKDILWLVVRWQLAKRRQGTHSTKTRSEVRGGGRKPWRQKHTGRARQGSIRAAQWVGGYTVNGPKPRNYNFKVNKKLKKLALKCALSYKAQKGLLKIVDGLPDLDAPRVKEGVNFLKKIGIHKETSLFILAEKKENIKNSFKNIKELKVLQKEGINVYDVLKFKNLILPIDSIDYLVERCRI